MFLYIDENNKSSKKLVEVERMVNHLVKLRHSLT